MESQPQNPEFSINPENFHPCSMKCHPQNPESRNNREHRGSSSRSSLFVKVLV